MGWKKADDVKLAELFRRGPSKGGISTKGLKPEDIHKVIANFFPDRNYTSFAPLFRRKVAAWNLEQELSGARKRKWPLHHDCCLL